MFFSQCDFGITFRRHVSVVFFCTPRQVRGRHVEKKRMTQFTSQHRISRHLEQTVRECAIVRPIVAHVSAACAGSEITISEALTCRSRIGQHTSRSCVPKPHEEVCPCWHTPRAHKFSGKWKQLNTFSSLLCQCRPGLTLKPQLLLHRSPTGFCPPSSLCGPLRSRLQDSGYLAACCPSPSELPSFASEFHHNTRTPKQSTDRHRSCSGVCIRLYATHLPNKRRLFRRLPGSLPAL